MPDDWEPVTPAGGAPNPLLAPGLDPGGLSFPGAPPKSAPARVAGASAPDVAAISDWEPVSLPAPAPAGKASPDVPTMTIKPSGATPAAPTAATPPSDPKHADTFADPLHWIGSMLPDGKTLKSVGEGLMTPVYGVAQLANHILPISDTLHRLGAPTKSNAEMDAELKVREQELHSEDGGKINWARMAGEVANPINYVGGAMSELTGLGRLATATIGGMYSAAIQPVTGNKGFAEEKTKQMAGGAVSSAASRPIGAGLARIAQPVSDEARRLMAAGVRLTPGQIMGGVVRRAEEAARSIPFLGQAIRHGEDITFRDFNRETYNEVLAPLGERYAGTATGYEGIESVRRQIGAAYDRVLPNVRFRADWDLANDFRQLQQLVSEMPPDQVRQYSNIARNRVWQRLQPTGTMDGRTFKQLESELTALAEPMHKDRDAAVRQLGNAVDELNNMLRRNLARQNPQQRADLEAANAAWYRFAKIRQAAGARVTSDGEFSPVDLLQAIRRQDFSPGKGRFAEGALPMQGWARAASDVIRPKLPDSGTTERRLYAKMLETAGIGGAGGAAAYESGYLPFALAGIAGASAPYNRPAMSALRGATMTLDPLRDATSQALQSPWWGPVAGALAGNDTQP